MDDGTPSDVEPRASNREPQNVVDMDAVRARQQNEAQAGMQKAYAGAIAGGFPLGFQTPIPQLNISALEAALRAHVGSTHETIIEAAKAYRDFLKS